ncbi:MAG: glycoside hydrolase family 25 protein [Rhodobacteraceae bacterium]|nr:glycoside hydrolase family 25 protein [Paracoccaceae bacterium]
MRLRPSLALVLLLAACGGGRQEAVVSGSGPVTGAEVRRANFGDDRPHEWEGRHPGQYAVHGIDVSRWQGMIDWRTARANGVNFAFLKATEGGDIVDPAFATNWSAARAAGVPTGAYHFWYHCRSGAEQARWYIRHVPRAAGALPPVLDMEWTPFSPTCAERRPASEIRREAAAFLRIVEAHFGRAAIIYTTPDFWEEAELSKLPGRHEFWLRAVTAHPSDRYEGQHWTFWQYTGTGLVPGIAGRTDINVFRGSPEAWAAWLAARAG